MSEEDFARSEGLERGISALKDDLSRVEGERDALRAQIVWGFYENEHPEYTQGEAGAHELTSPITAVEANGMVATIVGLQGVAEQMLHWIEESRMSDRSELFAKGYNAALDDVKEKLKGCGYARVKDVRA